MRIKKPISNLAEGDLTPMIDMTFQLIAFFMVLINFTEAEQDDRIKLPSSVLAKPPSAPLEHPVFLQLTRDGDVIIGGEPVPLAGIRPFLISEAEALEFADKPRSDATIIIRADASTPTGIVQELIQICQQVRFEKFALRAKEEVSY
jgi:biopolymer transport protein ExbD